jgi:YjjG family noncanonical pyrimidine nucleotidase
MNTVNGNHKYSCIFFDLDHTLWDYEANSRETLLELYGQYALINKGVERFDDFHRQFQVINLQLWDLYDRGLTDSETIRRERFKQVLAPFRAHDESLCEDLSRDYLRICPQKSKLMPHAIETLEYLSKRYELTIVTNGFEEIQHIKMTAGNLHQYFGHIITAQKAGHKKPSREIFDFALQLNAIAPHQAMMIGDNLITDIGGARNASIDAVFFNPEKTCLPARQDGHQETVYHEISSLAELREIL